MKLRQRIPKHIYDRGASGLGKPDFYVGPTIVERQPPRSQRAISQDDDLEAEMQQMKEAAANERPERTSVASQIVGLLRGRRKVRRA
ncbi:MAG TPA: hypothetical protein VF125_02815 [Solirubrobacterales bacterium]